MHTSFQSFWGSQGKYVAQVFLMLPLLLLTCPVPIRGAKEAAQEARSDRFGTREKPGKIWISGREERLENRQRLSEIKKTGEERTLAGSRGPTTVSKV